MLGAVSTTMRIDMGLWKTLEETRLSEEETKNWSSGISKTLISDEAKLWSKEI